jgi:hypothetical protein
MVIEVAGQVNAFTDAQLDRLTGELGPSTVAVLSAADHSRYGAVFLLADTERVGEAFVIGVARFGSAADFAGLPPLPIVRVEVIRCQTGRRVAADRGSTAAHQLAHRSSSAPDFSASTAGPS